MQLCFNLKNSFEKIILDLKNVFLLPHNFSKLVNQGFFNNHKIFYNNKNKTLYDKGIKEALAYTKNWKTNFFFYFLNFFIFTTYLMQINNHPYK